MLKQTISCGQYVRNDSERDAMVLNISPV